MSQFSMDTVTFSLFFLLITHWGEAQNCPVGCTYQSSQNKLECQTIPKAPLPPLTTEFKFVGSPENLTSEVFHHLKPSYSVDILDLSHGNIVNVGDGSFGAFGNVEIIDLSHNRIMNLGKDMFRGCAWLEEIRLSYNRIAKLADNFFSTTKLHTIYLDHNTLSDSPVFPRDLKALDISYNKIKNLTSPYMIPFTYLNVCGNPIEYASKSWWADILCMPRILDIANEYFLRSLQLEHMVGSDPVTNLTALNSMENLWNLKIDGFQISSFIWPNLIGSKITHLTFNHVSWSTGDEENFFQSFQLTSLNTLDLSNSSQLAKILLESRTVWKKALKYLQMLVLRSCNLTSLTAIRFKDYAPRDVLSIDVSDNPLHCDCDLANHLKVKNIQLAGEVAHCATPVRYSGRELPSILHLLCSSAQTPQESTTKIIKNEENTAPVDDGYTR